MNETYKSQRWTNATGILRDHKVHLRRNPSLESEDSRAFPHTILVSLIYRHAGPEGRPSSGEEMVRIDRTEESIADVMESSCGARFGLALTGGGTRDLFFFVREEPTEEQVEQLIQSVAPEVDYSFERLHDPEWHPYNELLGSLRNREDL